jgi:hypothetical protein
MEPSIIVALLLIIPVCYAHAAIPKFTQGTMHRAVAHAVLILVGCGCGAAGLWVPVAAVPREPGWLTFVIGFGVVHVLAAVILLIKQLRGSGRS